MEGLFDLPAVEVAADAQAPDPTAAPAELARHLEESLGVHVRAFAPLGRVRHGVTHHKIVMDVFEATFVRRKTASLLREPPAPGASRGIAAEADASGLQFAREQELGALGLSSLAKKGLCRAGLLTPLRTPAVRPPAPGRSSRRR
jgi:hypothetical protein